MDLVRAIIKHVSLIYRGAAFVLSILSHLLSQKYTKLQFTHHSLRPSRVPQKSPKLYNNTATEMLLAVFSVISGANNFGTNQSRDANVFTANRLVVVDAGILTGSESITSWSNIIFVGGLTVLNGNAIKPARSSSLFRGKRKCSLYWTPLGL